MLIFADNCQYLLINIISFDMKFYRKSKADFDKDQAGRLEARKELERALVASKDEKRQLEESRKMEEKAVLKVEISW